MTHIIIGQFTWKLLDFTQNPKKIILDILFSESWTMIRKFCLIFFCKYFTCSSIGVDPSIIRGLVNKVGTWPMLSVCTHFVYNWVPVHWVMLSLLASSGFTQFVYKWVWVYWEMPNLSFCQVLYDLCTTGCQYIEHQPRTYIAEHTCIL